MSPEALVGEIVLKWARIEQQIYAVAADGPPHVGYRSDVPPSNEVDNRFRRRLKTWRKIYLDALNGRPTFTKEVERIYTALLRLSQTRHDLVHNVSIYLRRQNAIEFLIKEQLSRDEAHRKEQALLEKLNDKYPVLGEGDQFERDYAVFLAELGKIRFGYSLSGSEVTGCISEIDDLQRSLSILFWSVASPESPWEI